MREARRVSVMVMYLAEAARVVASIISVRKNLVIDSKC